VVKINQIKQEIQARGIDLRERDLLLKHKKIFAPYGPGKPPHLTPDWFEALYYLGGVTITVTDDEYDKISSELKSIAFGIQSCRSLDVMQIIYQIFQNLGLPAFV
jgi:hypothetical protein